MPRSPRPNVVMLVADDHESRAMHWAGSSGVHTPNLDRIAQGGTAFTRSYHNGGYDDAVCIPTRASLFTGMNNFEALEGGRDVINPGRVTLTEQFTNHGYHSYMVGKWHNDLASLTRSFSDGDAIFAGGMHDHYSTPVRPFDPSGVFPESDITVSTQFATDLFCDTATRFIQSYDKEAPFFLYTAFTAPHDPRTPPEEYRDQYPTKNIKLPANYTAEHPFDLDVRDIRDENIAPYPRTPERIQEEIAAYYGMITAMDAGIGRIINALEARGELENTIIVYTADHGLAVGQHGLLGKQNVYEHSARVPLIMHGPGITAGKVSQALAYTWDSFPTLCELCAVPIPDGLHAQSLEPVLKQPTRSHRDHIATHYMGYHRMITEDRWKLIFTNVHNVPVQQLFDLDEDPFETKNLIDSPQHQEHLQRLLQRMEASPAGLPVSTQNPCY